MLVHLHMLRHSWFITPRIIRMNKSNNYKNFIGTIRRKQKTVLFLNHRLREFLKNLGIIYHRDFVHICGAALELNGKLILPDQREYHEALRASFRDLVNSLAEILDDPSLSDFNGSSSSNPYFKRNSVLVFTAIGGNGSTDA